jgi:propanol-preferring alcohol dehydrogenase
MCSFFEPTKVKMNELPNRPFQANAGKAKATRQTAWTIQISLNQGGNKMKAFRFTEYLHAAKLMDVALPEPGPGEALIRMGATGACHSDLHIMHEWTPDNFPMMAAWPLPFTLGHENAGWVEGGDLGGLEVGTPVVISPVWSCGVCRSCRQGSNNYCEEPMLTGGLGLDGGFAEYMVAPTDCLIPLKDLEPWQAAPLTDAGLTSYHAVKRCLPMLTPDAAVLVIGVGGLGQMAIEFLRELCSAKIIATARTEESLATAKELGAHLCIPSDDRAAEEIRKATRGLGAMVVLDFVGVDATLSLAAQVVRTQGQIVVIGIGGGTLPFQYGALPFGCTLVSTLGGSTGELTEIVALAEAGRLNPNIERYKLADVAEVYEKLHNGQITGRAVIEP